MSWIPESFSCDAAAKTIETYIELIKVPRKGLGYLKKSLKFGAKAFRGAEILSKLGEGFQSREAMSAYLFLGGSCVLTYLNKTPTDPTLSTFGKIKDLGWAFFEQSRKVSGAYGFLCAASKIAQDPKSHIIPFTFAAGMFLLTNPKA